MRKAILIHQALYLAKSDLIQHTINHLLPEYGELGLESG